MTQALTDDDRAEFFRILATAELYLPQVGADEAVADEGEGQTFITGEFAGQTVLPVFTSVEALAAFAGAYTTTSYTELREKWPKPDWWLAVNPGYPIDAYLPVEAVEAAARGELEIQTAGEAVVDAMAGDPEAASELLDTDGALRAAAVRADATGYIEALLDAMVVVPTMREVADPEEILEEDFPWLVAGTPDAPAIEVFTSAETFEDAFAEPGSGVVIPFALLLTVLPQDHTLAVNPRTPLGTDLSSDQVQSLLVWLMASEPDEPDTGGERLAP